MNGYDESREVIQKFVNDQRLTHPIVLMSGTTARDKYAVSGYPTNYWIDENGIIVDRSTGFYPGMERDIEKKLLELLKRKSGR